MKRIFPLSILSLVIFSGCGNELAVVSAEPLPPEQVAAIVEHAHQALQGRRDRLPRQGRVEAQRLRSVEQVEVAGASAGGEVAEANAERVDARGAEARAAKVAASGKAGLSPERIAKMKARVAANRAARQASAGERAASDVGAPSEPSEPSYDEG